MKRRGFSLIELLTVTSIALILVSIALPHAATLRRSVMDKEIRAQLAGIRDAANAYFKDHHFSYDGATLRKLGPYGYLHFDSAVAVSMTVESDRRFTASASRGTLAHTMTVDSDTGEVTVQ